MRRTAASVSASLASSSMTVKPLVLACAAALFAVGAHAQQPAAPAEKQPAPVAQTEKEKEEAAKKKAAAERAAPKVEAFVVTGIRGSIEKAIQTKQDSDSIVEAITAEDIGKLPDSSIAESIARLPGLAAQRVNGRATEINIRGLSGDFANTLLNGREQVSTGNNRSVEFDQYPSELLSSVLVYKTPHSGLLGQGLSGTIDLQTVRPLAVGKRTMAVNYRDEKNGEGTPFKGNGERFNVSYIDQFFDKKVGIALGYARLSQDVTKARSETYDENATFNLNGTNITHNQGFKYFIDATDEVRKGTMGVLEFKPNNDLHMVLDVFYSEFDKEIVKRGLEIQVNDSWKECCANFAYQVPRLVNPVVQNGRLISGTWENVNPLSRHIWEPRQDELESYGLNTKYKMADRWTGIVDLSYSKAKSKEQIIEMEAGQYDTTNNRPLPERVTVGNYNQITSLQYDRNNPSTLRLTDPESWGQNGYDKIITTDDKIKALRLAAQYDLEMDFFSKVEFGVNFNERDKSKGAAENFLRLPGGSSSGGALPSGTGGLALPGGLTTISFNPSSVYPSSYNLVPNVNGDILRKGWTVNEEITTWFAKGQISGELFGVPVRGNAGLQVVKSDQKSTAPAVDNTNQGQFVFRTDGKSYTDVLPSVNLVFDLPNQQIVRLGVGRQMARPRMDQLSAFTRSEVNNQLRWTGSGGNPKLDPFRANAFDVSYEKYFGTKGYISAAAFYKDLKSYILEIKNPVYDFTGLPNLSGRVPVSNLGEFTQPINGKGGSVSGVELAASVPLSMITPVLDGFGVVASYSDTESKIKPFGDGDVRPLPGLSRRVSTLTAYYEKYGFSFRVAARDRSPFIAEIEGFGADREFKYARGEMVTDLQLGYDFKDGWLKGLSLLLQVNNLKNEPYVEYDSGSGRDTKIDEYGRTILFGLTYKF